MTDKFVDSFLTHEGESVEDAKKRLAEEQGKHKSNVSAQPANGYDAAAAGLKNAADRTLEASRKAEVIK